MVDLNQLSKAPPVQQDGDTQKLDTHNKKLGV